MAKVGQGMVSQPERIQEQSFGLGVWQDLMLILLNTDTEQWTSLCNPHFFSLQQNTTWFCCRPCVLSLTTSSRQWSGGGGELLYSHFDQCAAQKLHKRRQCLLNWILINSPLLFHMILTSVLCLARVWLELTLEVALEHFCSAQKADLCLYKVFILGWTSPGGGEIIVVFRKEEELWGWLLCQLKGRTVRPFHAFWFFSVLSNDTMLMFALP